MDIILIMLMPRCEHGDEDKLLLSSSRLARVLEDKFMVYLPSIVQYATSVLSEDVSVSVTVSDALKVILHLLLLT
jgi:hypothetical protein